MSKILEAHNKVEEKQQMYRPFNILPLDPDSQNQTIMRIPEVSSCYLFIFPGSSLHLHAFDVY